MADNLFGQLGFPAFDRETTIQNRTREQTTLFNKLMAERAAALPAGERGVFQAFAQLGRQIGGTPVASLTPDEQRKFTIMENANKEMKRLQTTDEFNDLSQRDQALRTQDAIAQAALDAGDMQAFSEIALSTANARQAFARGDKELENIDSTIDSKEAQTKRTIQDTGIVAHRFGVEKQGQQGSFAIPDDEGKFNFSDEPELVTGFLGQDGNLQDASGNVHTSFLTTEDFDRFADNITQRTKAARPTGGSSPTSDFLKNIGSAERKALRLAKQDIQSQTRIIKSVGRAVDNAIQRGENPEAVVGSAGGFIRLADNMFRTARGAIDGFTPNFVTANGTRVDGVSGAVAEFGDDIVLPQGVEENAADAARYRSAIMQAVYVDARLAEPGARQLSDADIKNAMDRLGVSSGNPQTIFSTLMQNFNSRTEGIRGSIDTIRGVGASSGLSRDKAETLIFGDDTVKILDASSESLDELGKSVFNVAPENLEEPTPIPAALPTSAAGAIDFGDGFILTPVTQ